MESPQEQTERVLKNEMIRALEDSSKLIQEMQKVPRDSALSLIKRGFLATTLSATWGQGHLDALADFAIQAGALAGEEQLVGFNFNNERFTLLNKEFLNSSKRPRYLDAGKLGTIFVKLGGGEQKAIGLFPGYIATSR